MRAWLIIAVALTTALFLFGGGWLDGAMAGEKAKPRPLQFAAAHQAVGVRLGDDCVFRHQEKELKSSQTPWPNLILTANIGFGWDFFLGS